MSAVKPPFPPGAARICVALGFALLAGAAAVALGAAEVGVFVAGLAAFHLCEFGSVLVWRRDQLSIRSFAFNGLPYAAAVFLGLLEHGVRTALFGPAAWQTPTLLVVGAVLMVTAGATRVWAMRTAGTNFNHLVQRDLEDGHRLVEAGPYRWLRHPSYFGFYWFSIGSQLVLGNPITLMLYLVVLQRFFAARIPGEEAALERRFGEAYRRFRSTRVLGLPGVRA